MSDFSPRGFRSLLACLLLMIACEGDAPRESSVAHGLVLSVVACPPTLQNQDLLLGFDFSNGIALTDIYDKVRNYHYLSAPTLLFEFAVNNGTPYQSDNGVVVDSCSASTDSLSFNAHALAVPLSFTLTFTMPAGETAAIETLHVSNTGSSKIFLRTVYPKLHNFMPQGGLSRMMGAVPTEIGSVAPLAQVARLGMPFKIEVGLPTAMNVMEVADAYDSAGTGGLFVADLDGDLAKGIAPVQLNLSSTEIAGFWTANLKAYQHMTLPRLALGVHHDGDWHRAVDYYVSKRQPSWTCPVIPSWLRNEGAIYSSTGPGSGGAYQQSTFPEHDMASELNGSFVNLPNLLTDARRLGTNVVYLNDWWDGGYFDKGDYVPRADLGGAAALMSGIAALHNAGGRIILYVEPFIVYKTSMLAQSRLPNGSYTGVSWSGEPTFGSNCSYGASGCDPGPGCANVYANAGDGYWSMVAPFQPWQDYLTGVATRIVGQYGADGVWLDSWGWQMNWPVKTAAEEVRYTSQQWSEGAVRLVDKVRSAIQSLKPDAVVLGETTSGQLGQHWDGGLSGDLADAGFQWLECENQDRIMASPVRYGMKQVNFYSNGRMRTNGATRTQLNEIFAAGHNLALGPQWLGSSEQYIQLLVNKRKQFADALIYGNQYYQPATGSNDVAAYFYRGTSTEIITVVNVNDSAPYLGNLTLGSSEANSSWIDELTTQTFQANGTQLPVWLQRGTLRILRRTDAFLPLFGFPQDCPAPTYDPVIVNTGFDDGNLDAWTVIDGCWWSSSSSVSVYSNPGPCTTTGGGTMTYDRRTGANFAYSADVAILSDEGGGQPGGEVGLSFRLNDAGSQGYDLIASHAQNIIKLAKRPYRVLASAPYTFNLNQTYNLRVIANGTSIIAYVNGVRVLSVVDGSYGSGRVGLTNYRSWAQFDNASAGPIPPPVGSQ